MLVGRLFERLECICAYAALGLEVLESVLGSLGGSPLLTGIGWVTQSPSSCSGSSALDPKAANLGRSPRPLSDSSPRKPSRTHPKVTQRLEPTRAQGKRSEAEPRASPP